MMFKKLTYHTVKIDNYKSWSFKDEKSNKTEKQRNDDPTTLTIEENKDDARLLRYVAMYTQLLLCR